MAQKVEKLPAMQESEVQLLVGEIPQRRKWLPISAFLPGEFHGQRSLAGYSPWGRKELALGGLSQNQTSIRISVLPLASCMTNQIRNHFCKMKATLIMTSQDHCLDQFISMKSSALGIGHSVDALSLAFIFIFLTMKHHHLPLDSASPSSTCNTHCTILLTGLSEPGGKLCQGLFFSPLK